MRVEDPTIIVDAWDWHGFDIEHTDSKKVSCGLMGVNLRVKGNGSLEADTSWGIENFTGGDKIIALDVASIVSNLKKMGLGEKDEGIKAKVCCDLFTCVFVHELSHWAEEYNRPDRKHGPVWDKFFFKSVYNAPKPLTRQYYIEKINV